MSSAGKSVVLVHGGFVDGAGWKGGYDILKKDGYDVAIVQNPTLSLAGDNAATRQILDEQTEPVVLVGHSTAARLSARRARTRRSLRWCT